MNGRLLPPDAIDARAVTVMSGVTFLSAGDTSSAAAIAADHATVTVVPHVRGALVSIGCVGSAATSGIEGDIAMAIELAEAVEHSGQLLGQGEFQRAASAAAVALDDDARSIRPHSLLRSRLRLHHAVALAETGQLAAARSEVARALADGASCQPARMLRARLDARMANDSMLQRHLRVIANTPHNPTLAHAAQVQRQRLQRDQAQPDRAAMLRQRARAWLAEGDPVAAHQWTQRASASEPPSATPQQPRVSTRRQLSEELGPRGTSTLELRLHGQRPGSTTNPASKTARRP